VAIFDRDAVTGVGSEAGYGRLRVGERHGGACRHATALSSAHRLAASPDGMNVYVATGVSNAVAVFDRYSVTGALT
jgi:DNA-binding beta-propeller fold protein YncE